jgi:hypothetical protein
VDDDGDADFAVANQVGDKIAVHMNAGDGTFFPPVSYPIGNKPDSLAMGDLDNDGDLDIAAANFNSTSVGILINNGNGTFFFSQGLPVGSAQSVALGDFDGDGDLDIASANYGTANVSIIINHSTNDAAVFALAVNYPADDGPFCVAAGDIDGDGDVDLAVSNFLGDDVSLLTNNTIEGAPGTFAPPINIAVGDGPEYVALRDIDHDGDLDLIIANSIANTISIMRNTGDGTFSAASVNAVGTGPVWIDLGDLNGDGNVDLATANVVGNTASILLNPCSQTVAGDVTADGLVNIDDLLAVIDAWGACPSGACPADLVSSGVVDIDDLLFVIDHWSI